MRFGIGYELALFQDLRSGNTCIIFLSLIFWILSSKLLLTLYHFLLCQLPWGSLVWGPGTDPWWNSGRQRGTVIGSSTRTTRNIAGRGFGGQRESPKEKKNPRHLAEAWDTGWAKTACVPLTQTRSLLMLTLWLCHCVSLICWKDWN